MPGILERFGSWGRSIIASIREQGRSILEAVRLVQPIAPEVSYQDAVKDFGQVTRIDEKQSIIQGLAPDQVIPDYLHEPVDIPFNRPYAYTVTIQGRAVAGRIGPGGKKIGGQFTRDEFNITSNIQLTPAQIEQIAIRRFGAAGEYPLVSIRNISVTAAMTR